MSEVEYSRDGQIARIHLNAPGRANRFSLTMRRELNEALKRYRDDRDAWIAIISGEGSDFCAGSDDEAPDAHKERRERSQYWAGGYVEIWKPLIGALRGQVTGEGLALALSCDLRVADDTAVVSAGGAEKFSNPEVTGAWLVPLVGVSLAFEILYLGRSFKAEEAQSRGLVNRVIRAGPAPELASRDARAPMNPASSVITVPSGEANEGAVAFAEELLQWAPMTRNFQKEIAYRSIGLPFFYIETLELGDNPYASEDSVEGARAFSESRFPVWKNR